jgi:hypothetical protein
MLRAVVILGLAIWGITESLSLFGFLRRGPLAAAWILAVLAAIFWARRRAWTRPRIQFDWLIALYIAACIAIFAATALAAGFSPPNSSDAMAYHVPRILYWAEQGSVRFFPTQYLNQIMLQPFAEYAMLQSYILSGGDRFLNFGQWIASVLCAVAVSMIAREFGANGRAQALAALFSAAIPSGILASSGAKNDYVMALWLAAAVYFALCCRRTRSLEDAAFLGCALGLAMLTKATAYLFAPLPLAALIAPAAWENPRRGLRAVACVAGCALAINVPHYIRNWELSGTPMGYGDAFGTGEFRWRNETLGWKQTLSNVLRNASEQLGARSEKWNHAVYEAVIAVHHSLGIDPADHATTWKWTEYAPPRNANHEADAPNRVHLALLGALFGVLLWRASRGRDRLMAMYAASLIAGFILFCAYLKWQPFMGRMFLPLFVLGAPLAALARPVWLQIALCALLLDGARHPAIDNWVRPLRGPHSVFVVAREQQYFSDMTTWKEDWPAYWAAVDELARSHCGVIGVDVANYQLEYPLEALLRDRSPGVKFVHSDVKNASARFAQPVSSPPCAVVCLHCEGGDWQSGRFTIRYRR